MAHLESNASNVRVPPANDMVHAEHNGSNTSPVVSNIARSESNIANATPLVANDTTPLESNAGPPSAHNIPYPGSDAINVGAQIQDMSPQPASNNQLPQKVRNDVLITRLCDLLRTSQFDNVQEILKLNPRLDLNIVPASSTELLPDELPLHLALQDLDEQTVECLLAADANPETFCGFGRNALQCVAAAGCLDGDALNYLTRCYEKREAKKKYINSFDKSEDRTVTHIIAESAQQPLEAAVALDMAGANWQLKNHENETPFELAAKHGHWIITSYLARQQWDSRVLETDVHFSDWRWIRVHVQNTAYIQSFVRKTWPFQERLIDRIVQHITPEFRFDRNREDPVGGSGREPICVFKKLEKVDFMSLAIPYISFETTDHIKTRTEDYQKIIKKYKYCSDSNFNYLGLQCASTLDEYCHPSLDEGTLRDRNGEQVLSRYQKDIPDKQKIVITVPQLWIWTIGKNIITAMHKQTYDVITAKHKQTYEEFDRRVFNTIEDHHVKISSAFNPSESQAPRPTFFGDLFVGLMISECVNRLDSPSRHGLWDSIFGIFEKSISELSAKVREYTPEDAMSENSLKSEEDFILQIAGIREELSMIQSVLFEQEQVWRQHTKAKFPELWSKPPEDQFVVPSHVIDRVSNGVSNGVFNRILEVMEILERPQKQFAKYKRRIAKLDADAERVEGSVSLQLDLKSKHASLQEAHLTTLMSAAIIGFTIVTIIFTPLAFLASIFALSTNVSQNHQRNSTLANGAPFYHNSYIGKWMVTIEFTSLTVTGLAIWLALKLVTGFSSRETVKRIWKKAWSKEKPSRNMASRPIATDEAQMEKRPTVQQPAAVGQAAIQRGRNQSRWNRFQTRTRGPRQQHVESVMDHDMFDCESQLDPTSTGPKEANH